MVPPYLQANHDSLPGLGCHAHPQIYSITSHDFFSFVYICIYLNILFLLNSYFKSPISKSNCISKPPLTLFYTLWKTRTGDNIIVSSHLEDMANGVHLKQINAIHKFQTRDLQPKRENLRKHLWIYRDPTLLLRKMIIFTGIMNCQLVRFTMRSAKFWRVILPCKITSLIPFLWWFCSFKLILSGKLARP
jgi:hypothetical protein